MRNIPLILDYFFSFKGTLARKSFVVHYFLDMFVFFIMLLFASLSVPVIAPYTDNIKIFGMSLLVVFFAPFALLVVAFFVLNRLSIILRRLRYRKMSNSFCLLVFVPIIGFLFDFYLLVQPDEDRTPR